MFWDTVGLLVEKLLRPEKDCETEELLRKENVLGTVKLFQACSAD
jgi:hypothetical protein